MRNADDDLTKPKLFQPNLEKHTSLIKEDFRFTLLSWHTVPQSFIFESLEKFILDCHQHGILVHLIDKLLPTVVKKDEDEPEVLTLYILSAGFFLWLYTVLIAILVFLMEHIVHLSKTRWIKAKVTEEVKKVIKVKKVNRTKKRKHAKKLTKVIKKKTKGKKKRQKLKTKLILERSMHQCLL